MPVMHSKALSALRTLLLDPMDFRATMEFVDATLDAEVLRRLHLRMLRGLSDAEVAHLRELTDRPIDLGALSRLPPSTFGHQLSAFMASYHLRQDAQIFSYPPLADRLAKNWIVRRFCRVHDMHHVLLGLGAEVPSELALQFFNFRNFREPYAACALLATPVVLLRHGNVRRTLTEIRKAWSTAGRAANLFQVPFEDLLDTDLGALRRRLGVS